MTSLLDEVFGGGEPAEEARKPAERPAAGPAKPGSDLELYDTEIVRLQGKIDEVYKSVKAGTVPHGLAALYAALDKLVERRAKLRPPVPPTEDEEEKRWRADADQTIRTIEAGVEEIQRRKALA